MSAFKRWIRGPKENTRGMPRSLGDHYENLLPRNLKLVESNGDLSTKIQQGKKFSSNFKKLDQRDTVKIKVGNQLAVLSADIIPADDFSRIELSGFVTPKKIKKIHVINKKIDFIEFEDGSKFPETSEFTTVEGINITNTLFFPNSQLAEQALTKIWMLTSQLEGQGWKIETYIDKQLPEDTYFEHLTKQLAEKIPPGASVDYYIKDFAKSNAPQFRGKSPEKRRQMAIAAHYSAQQPKKSKRKRQ